MSDENFTKGEWEVLNSYPSVDILHGHPAVWSGGYCVAQMCDLEESAANAHLIAAAPEMYAMLKFLVENDSINDHSIDKEVLTLLTKAKGEVMSIYKTMESAPTDGTHIIGLYQDGEASIFFSERPVCMLGDRCGGFPPGWATSGEDTDYNLPMDEPLSWREEEVQP